MPELRVSGRVDGRHTPRKSRVDAAAKCCARRSFVPANTLRAAQPITPTARIPPPATPTSANACCVIARCAPMSYAAEQMTRLLQPNAA